MNRAALEAHYRTHSAKLTEQLEDETGYLDDIFFCRRKVRLASPISLHNKDWGALAGYRRGDKRGQTFRAKVRTRNGKIWRREYTILYVDSDRYWVFAEEAEQPND